MIRFKTEELKNIYATPLDSLNSKYKKKYPQGVLKKYKKMIEILDVSTKISEIRQFDPHFEALKGDRLGQYSTRLNDKYRLILEITTT